MPRTLAGDWDYHLASPTVAHQARRATIYKAEKFSDHAPLTIDYDLLTLNGGRAVVLSEGN